jgi:hypothetical protein
MINRKNILLVSNAFYPEISPRSYRATELAKEFSRQGHKVSVISKFRDHDYAEFLEENSMRFEMWKKSVFPTVPRFKRQPLMLISRLINRILTVLFEYPLIEETFRVKNALKQKNGYDLMISFAVPYTTHWGVAWSRTKNHRIADTWIADCGDPYMGDVMDSFRKPFYFKYIEKRFCRKADYITIPVHEAIDGYYPEFHDKIRIIPQGFDFNLEEKSLEKNPDNSIPEFAYAGTFIKGSRDPGPLLEFLCKIDFPFRFYVYTNRQEMLIEFQEKLNDKLVISGYIPRSELMDKMSGMDFLINFDNNSSRHLPSKLIDYALTNRPVLNIKKDFKEEHMISFLNGDYVNRMDLPDPEQYHIKNVAMLFLKLS